MGALPQNDNPRSTAQVMQCPRNLYTRNDWVFQIVCFPSSHYCSFRWYFNWAAFAYITKRLDIYWRQSKTIWYHHGSSVGQWRMVGSKEADWVGERRWMGRMHDTPVCHCVTLLPLWHKIIGFKMRVIFQSSNETLGDCVSRQKLPSPKSCCSAYAGSVQLRSRPAWSGITR